MAQPQIIAGKEFSCELILINEQRCGKPIDCGWMWKCSHCGGDFCHEHIQRCIVKLATDYWEDYHACIKCIKEKHLIMTS